MRVVTPLRPLAALVGLLLLASCSGGGELEFSRPDGEDPPPPAADNADLYGFTAPRLGGGSQVTGSELQGKDVALWFWAPW
ncbi:hypothetical protein BH23ACT12_BH23ACT12_19160 [soil metagenome]